MRIHIHSNGGSRILAIGLLCLALAGCLPDDLRESGGKDAKEEARSYGLGFTISTDVLTKASGSAGMTYGNEIENYIDPRRLRVLFLDRNGNFQFEFSQYEYKDPLVESGQRETSRLKSGLHLEPLRLSHGDAVTQWFARIPIDQLSDEELKLITDEGFKVAIMANWPDDTFKDTGDNDVKTNFLIEGSEQNIANRLAHCHYDPFYNETGTDSDTTNIHNSYLPFLGKDKSRRAELTQSSVTSSWLQAYFTDKGEAENHIRQYYTFADGKGDNGEYQRSYVEGPISRRKYYNMWYIWNFDGSRSDKWYTKEYDHKPGSNRKSSWKKRNEEIGWIGWIKDKQQNQEDQKIQLETGIHDGLVFASNNNIYWEDDCVLMPSIGTLSDHRNGIKEVFTFIEDADLVNSTPKEGFGYFRVPMPADGMLRLKVGKANGSISLGVHICEEGQFGETEPATIKSRRQHFEISEDKMVIEIPATINERPMYAFIYALGDNSTSLKLYEIEYIKAEHLYDVDRDGIMPDKNNPIPMYGIQDFDPIGEYWTPGELFNLSAFNGLHPERKYNYKWISLLRSVAKVELKIAKAPFNWKQPQYVYMRSMNQTARLNPIDVLTPTDQIWYGDAEHNIVGIEQETSNIQAYGPMFQGREAENKIANKLEFFRNRLAWFYGIWTHPIVGISSSAENAASGKKWDWNHSTDENINISYDNSIPSPRVFNPHINRSDYTHFYCDRDREDDDYWYYTLYMPEKHMTDANKASDLTSKPKCLHIEMRWEGVNDDSGLDDNASYRIYFANTDLGGTPSGFYDRDGYENVTGNYEEDLANLRTFYPIVRNHVYEVTVKGINRGDVGLNVRRAAERKPNFSFE